FKERAIEHAMELVTSPKWFGIPLDKLYFTVFGGAEVAPGNTLGPDEEAEKFWVNVGAPKERVIRVPGLKENFWAMGDTGPCGPCSEIHYDMGPEASDQGHKDCKFPCDCGRYVEIWNLVFMQFNRDASGKLNPLPKPSVDTGMGLERVAAVLQGVVSNYDTDLFAPLIEQAANVCGVDLAVEKQMEEGKGGAASLRVISDHARAVSFLIADGVIPSNEGRGYVLRKIMRRAILHGRLLGASRAVLINMLPSVHTSMKGAYPELESMAALIHRVVHSEESRFSRTLSVGLEKLEEALQPANIEVNVGSKMEMTGAVAFQLYDTFGVPIDLIQEAVKDRGGKFDEAGFAKAMAEQQQRSKASWKGGHKEVASPVYAKLAETFKTEPDFYFDTTTRDCHIEAIVTKNGQVNELKAGEEAEVVLDRSTIYAESGGQVADIGALFDNNLSMQVAEVKGAYYPVAGLIAHKIVANENLAVGDRVATVADAARRARVKRNHTGTHLMHAALRNILGTHVKQAGSLNAPDHLRFDFSHFAAVGQEELTEIEQQVNEEILRDLELQTDILALDDALASGALAFFGDKYPEQNVRVVTIADANYPRGFYSKELCGGTHVGRTGEIGVFKIGLEQSVAAGVRRIEALTGDAALTQYQQALGTLRQLAAMLNTGEDRVAEAIEKLTQTVKQLEKQLDGLKRKTAVSMADGLLDEARMVKDVKVLAARVPGMDREALRQMADGLRQKMGSGVVILATAEDGKVALIAAVTKDLTKRLHAGKMVQELAKLVGGSGGGRPDLAEAGGKDVAAMDTALAQAYPLVERQLV
ncbi:MAG TPA: alanine--tRNA ligase, partial [Candidatus Acidoferrales bacterium]|nr:alanine--tRNA ligase [Candidatus Acidoferrales bacterium]